MDKNNKAEDNIVDVDDIDYQYKIDRIIEMLQRVSNRNRGYEVNSNEQKN